MRNLRETRVFVFRIGQGVLGTLLMDIMCVRIARWSVPWTQDAQGSNFSDCGQLPKSPMMPMTVSLVLGVVHAPHIHQGGSLWSQVLKHCAYCVLHWAC